MSAGNLTITVIGSFEKFLIKLAITKEQLFSNAKRSTAIKKKDILEGCLMVAHNGQGLALLGDLKNVRPELKPN
jgi:hypothetical protein